VEFDSRCLELVDLIPKGRITTYKEIAKALNTKAYRAVGNALNKNKNLIKTPCHRVVRSDGSLGGYALGMAVKKELLISEGIVIEGVCIKDFDRVFWSFDI